MGWWTRGPTIGRGSTATVSLATAVTTGEIFAVKSNDLSCSTLLQKEESIISQLKSPYIVKYFGSDITIENSGGGGRRLYNLLMEYMPGGTLTDLIKKQGGSLPESMIQLYAHQILQGLDYLHMNGIAHCDIKGQNILIGEDGVKIADLGCAKRIVSSSNSVKKTKISGTPIFMAPEVARGEEQGFSADIWAFGCTIIEMATGTVPWPELNDPVSALYKIGYSSTDVPEFPKWFSGNAKDFLKNCLRRDSKERWTVKQLLQHPFFYGIDAADIVGRNSPTSVFDQECFWDSMEEVSEHDSSPIHSSLISSPTDRIKNLIGDGISNLPNWAEQDEDGENWVTVRGITVREDIPQISEKIHNVEAQDPAEEVLTSSMETISFSVDQLQSSIATAEELLLNSLLDFEIGSIENLYSGIEDIMLMHSDNIVKDAFASKILDSQIKITEFTGSDIFQKNISYSFFNFIFIVITQDKKYFFFSNILIFSMS